jgi:hypothetical protein
MFLARVTLQVCKRAVSLMLMEVLVGLHISQDAWLSTAWSDRYKQILKKWRALPSDRKAPFLQQARENRAALRMKKAQQVSVCTFVDDSSLHFMSSLLYSCVLQVQ